MALIQMLFYSPAGWEMLPCLSKQVLGMDCPGCGLQRAAVLLINGRVWESFLMYPGLLPMLALFGFIALDRFLQLRHGTRITTLLAVLTVSAILLNFLLKIIF